MEYKKFAQYYDLFYQNKNYYSEVLFLRSFANKGDSILDAGCGTGIHGELLEEAGYLVDGVDLNEEMLELAREKMKGNLYKQNILDLDIDKKYDLIISMFAVLNHLRNTRELTLALRNFRKHLKPGGSIVIDLHNPQCSGQKMDEFNDMIRIMKWNYNKLTKIEKSKIDFHIDNIEYHDSHVFRVFSIKEIHTCCRRAGLKVIKTFENYDITREGSVTSKNLQFFIQVDKKK